MVIRDTVGLKARRGLRPALPSCARSTRRFTVTQDDQQQARRDIRAAIIFGIVAASLELGALLYFFR